MKRALIPGLLVVSAGFAPYLRNVAEFPDWAFEVACEVASPLRGKNNALAVSIPQSAVRRRIERGFHPVPEHPAIERRTQ
jgi:hypothetical protein